MKILKESPNDYEEFCMLRDEFVLKIKVNIIYNERNTMRSAFLAISSGITFTTAHWCISRLTERRSSRAFSSM
jgi:hypothetical protein